MSVLRTDRTDLLVCLRVDELVEISIRLIESNWLRQEAWTFKLSWVEEHWNRNWPHATVGCILICGSIMPLIRISWFPNPGDCWTHTCKSAECCYERNWVRFCCQYGTLQHVNCNQLSCNQLSQLKSTATGNSNRRVVCVGLGANLESKIVFKLQLTPRLFWRGRGSMVKSKSLRLLALSPIMKPPLLCCCLKRFCGAEDLILLALLWCVAKEQLLPPWWTQR